MSHLRDVARLLGELRQFETHAEADIYCLLANQKVTLVCNANGVVVCRSWKKCKTRVLATCPERLACQAMLKELKKKNEEKHVARAILFGMLKERVIGEVTTHIER